MMQPQSLSTNSELNPGTRSRLASHASWALVIALAVFFVLYRSGLDLDYVIPRRLGRLTAMVVAGVCLAWSAITFQTLTGNRILTPAIMGYEAVFGFLQAVLVLVLGTQSVVLVSANSNFLVSVLLMLGYSWLMQRWLLREGQQQVYFLLLFGLVLTMLIHTLTQFIQIRVSPGEFAVLQGFNQVSFQRTGPAQLLLSMLVVVVLAVLSRRTLPTLDVLSLGREQAIALGVEYGVTVRRYFVLIAVLVAVATSLVGPSVFMGVFVANIAYALANGMQHRRTLNLGCSIAIGMFLLAQLAVEHVFNYRTTVGILVNLVCGAWFLGLVVRQRGSA